MTGTMRVTAAVWMAMILCGPVAAAPAPLPSLAKINGLLDQARDLERKGSWAAIPPIYAEVVKICGEPAPHHLRHVVAKALVKSGHAYLALGKLPEAHAAYRDADTRYGKEYAPVIRQWVLQARTLMVRVEEIGRMSGQPIAAAAPPPSAAAKPEPEPLVLVTDRGAAATGDETKAGAQGYEVQTFDGTEDALIRAAEAKASTTGRKVLATGREMAVVKPEILPGSCWDWVNAVFTRAGFPMGKPREVVAKAPEKGPYLDPAKLRPGDWMYYRNRSYGNGVHSGIFVGWINGPSKVALVLSYPGQDRKEPGRYRPYELTGVYRITRPV